jgi:hypothetical protein
MTFDFTQLIYRKKDAFTKDECKFLIEEHARLNDNDVLEHCPDANTGEDTYSTFKRASLVEGTEAYKLVFRANEQLINEYMDYLDSFGMFHMAIRETMKFSHMYRLLKYETGAKIHPHSDHIPFVYGSATFNLNDEYTGGDFSFWNGKYKVKLAAGEAMIWPADYFWVHEVEPITSGVRYATNSFLLSIPQPAIDGIIKLMMKEENNPAYQELVRRTSYRIKNT